MAEKSKKSGSSHRGENVKAKLPEASATKTRESRRFDWRWMVFGIILIVVIVWAIVMNMQVTDNSANKIMNTIAVDNSDLKVNWERYQTVDVKLSETLRITESGTYHLTGTLNDGSVIIDAGVAEVRLILDNVTIVNSTGPAIECYNAENLVIETIGNNYLKDGAKYAADYDEDVNGVIYSKADLAFIGEGVLNITTNFADAIVGKDDVVIRGGEFVLTAVDDAIRGKDSVYITNGKFTINAGGDAIKSTNETDYGKGFIMIEQGEFAVEATGKGIKAVNSILIYGGELILDTYDDAVHSNNYVGLVAGDLTLTAGDDGIHADRELIIDGGKVNIIKSYEGLEAQIVTINGGEISIVATDDGINAGGGADNSATGRPGENPFKTDENCVLAINGGEIYVNAAGDGVDSNGYLYFNGGSTVVDGPTNNGNGALDAGLGIIMEGGKVIAVGAAGMAEAIGNDSGVCNISVYFPTMQAAGTLIEVRNANGETVLSHVTAKTFNHLAAGSESLNLGETYTIYLNGTEYQSFTIMEVTTTIGNSNFNQNNILKRKM